MPRGRKPRAQAQQIKLKYKPFPVQREFHESTARFRVLDCGRRWGKTVSAIHEAFFMLRRYAKEHGTRERVWVIAPTYDLVQEAWRHACEYLGPVIREQKIADKTLVFNEGEIEFKSSDRNDAGLRGAGLIGAIFDETAWVSQTSWERGVRPALADKQGRAVFISTPNGRNWFYQLYCRAHTDPNWRSWKLPTNARPDFPAAEWVEIQRTTSERDLQSEYLAEFLEDAGQLWNVERCLRGQLRPAIPGRSYVAGLDVAAARDWMVTAVFEVESKQLVGLHRSHHRSWSLQKAEAVHLLRQYPRVRTAIDATGVGDPIAQDLAAEGLNIEAVVFTPHNKKDLVKNLAIAIDHGYIGLPNATNTTWLLDELRSYQETKLPSGAIRFSAPEGQHDDGVSACLLAVWLLRFDLHKPTLEPAPLPGKQGFTFEDMLEWNMTTQRWRKQYPHLKQPAHPHSLKWGAHSSFLRKVKRDMQVAYR